MAVASLVLGIFSIVLSVFTVGGFGLGGAAAAIVGIVLAGKNKEEEKASLAKAGKVCSIVGLIISLVFFIVFFVCARIFFTAIGSELLRDFVSLVKYILF